MLHDSVIKGNDDPVSSWSAARHNDLDGPVKWGEPLKFPRPLDPRACRARHDDVGGLNQVHGADRSPRLAHTWNVGQEGLEADLEELRAGQLVVEGLDE